MKTKAKLLLAISTLSAVVLAAGVTSTFAWLTTQDRATLTSKMTVKAASNITISVKKLGFVASDLGSDKGNVTDNGIELGTVSSKDGLTFFAPTALVAGLDGAGSAIAEPYSGSTFAEVTTSTAWDAVATNTNKYVGYLKYCITVKAPQEEEGNRHQLYYNISVANAGSHVVNAYRIALYETDGVWDTYAKGTHTATKKGIWANDADTTTKGMIDTTYGNAETASCAALSTAFAKPIGTTYITDNALTKYYIFTVWVEGMDADAINHTASSSIAGEAFDASIEFSLGALAS